MADLCWSQKSYGQVNVETAAIADIKTVGELIDILSTIDRSSPVMQQHGQPVCLNVTRMASGLSIMEVR